MVKGYEADPKRMTFLEHLGELRMVLIHTLIVVTVGTVAAWAWSGKLLDLLIVSLGLENVQFLSPMEGFNARFKVALAVGLCGTAPLVALRIWAFIVPALRMRERRAILPSALATGVLFALGVAFSLFVLTPLMLDLLMGFETEHARAHLALGPLLSFLFAMSLACALLFQMPLVIGVTTLLGVTSPRWLLGKWRHAIVLIFILAAVVTPGDGPSQVILALPLIVLYFISVLVSAIIWRAKGRERAQARTGARNERGGPGDEGDEGPLGPVEPPPGTRARASSGVSPETIVPPRSWRDEP